MMNHSYFLVVVFLSSVTFEQYLLYKPFPFHFLSQIEVLWSKGEKPLPPLHPLLIKGRNLYRMKTMRQVTVVTYFLPLVGAFLL